MANGAYSESYAEWYQEYFDNMAQFNELYPEHQVVEQFRYAPHITQVDDARLPAIIDLILGQIPEIIE